MNYARHLERAISTYGDVDFVDSSWDDGEHCVVILRNAGFTYGQIQN